MLVMHDYILSAFGLRASVSKLRPAGRIQLTACVLNKLSLERVQPGLIGAILSMAVFKLQFQA